MRPLKKGPLKKGHKPLIDQAAGFTLRIWLANRETPPADWLSLGTVLLIVLVLWVLGVFGGRPF